MTLRPVPNPTPYIACILAVAEYQDRTAQRGQPIGHIERPQPWRPTHLADLSLVELSEAREIARRQRYTMAEAAEIVRRSRR